MAPSVVRSHKMMNRPSFEVDNAIMGCLENKHVEAGYTVEPDLIATKMLAFPSKSSRNKNYCYLMIAIL